MSHIQSTIQSFREKFKCECILCKETEHKFTTTAECMESFLIQSHLSYLQEEKKRLEGKIENSKLRSSVTWNVAINSELDIINAEIKEIEGLMKTK
jgi:hypothetical protein